MFETIIRWFSRKPSVGKNLSMIFQKKISGTRYLYLTTSYLLGFSGFNLFLLTFYALSLGEQSRIFSVPYRFTFLLLSGVFIFYFFVKDKKLQVEWFYFPLFIFWGSYFLRIFFDGYFNAVPLSISPAEYIQKSIGMVFIPMFLFLSPLTERENKVAFKIFVFGSMACVGLLFFVYRDVIFTFSYRSLRYAGLSEKDLISTITLSYIGAIIFVLGFFLQNKKEERLVKLNLRSFFIFLMLFSGGLLILQGGTRSAVIFTSFVCFILMLFNESRNSWQKLLKITGSILSILMIIFFLQDAFGAALYGRIDTLYLRLTTGNIEQAGGGRIVLYRDALAQFWEKPLFGSGLEERNSMFYPHNHLIEAFMATGLFGGFSFLVLVLAAFKNSIFILNNKYEYGWVSCVYLLYFIKGLFSHSILEPGLWYSMMMVFGTTYYIRRSKGL